MRIFGIPRPSLLGWPLLALLLAAPALAQPQLTVSPSSLTQTLGPDATATQSLTVTNTGTAPLTFSTARGPATAPAGGPDTFGYTWTDSDRPGGPVYQWVDIRASGTHHPMSSVGEVWVDLPFSFSFYGQGYTRVKVYADGLISFYPSYQGTPSNNRPIPYWDRPDLFIAGFWDNLDPSRGEGVYTGVDARGRFIVQYQEVALAGDPIPPGRFTFQIILDPSGTIVIQYGPMTGATNGATVGIENGNSTTGLEIAYDEPYVRDGLAVRIAKGDPWFSVVGAGTLAPGASAQVAVAFSSHDLRAGTYTNRVVLTSNDPARPTVNVPVSLTVLSEPDIEVSETALDFGAVFVGEPQMDTLLVTNAGSGPLTISSVATDNPAFLAALSGSPTLQPGERRNVLVSFGPPAPGPFTGTLTVTSNDPNEPTVTVTLAGEGLLAPDVEVSPSSLSATLEPGETTTQTLTITNSGGSGLTFDLLVGAGDSALDSLYYDFGGSTAGTYGWTPWMPFTVANRFTAEGRFNLNAVRAFLEIERDSTVRVAVYGEGTFGEPMSGPLLWSRDVPIPHTDGALFEIPLDTTLTFEDEEDFYIVIGTQEEFAPFGAHHSNGGRSYYRTPHGPQWYHEEGSTTWVIRALTTTGVWLDAEPLAGTVAPGASLDVTVTLDASFVPGGEYTSALTVGSNDPDEEEVTVPVTLDVGGVPDIAITPDSLVFGEIYLGDSATLRVRIRNLGTGPLTVSNVASSNPAFTFSPPAPFTVGGGENDTLHVTFAPATAGVHEGVLSIASDDPDTPVVSVALAGEGVDFPELAVTPDSIQVALLAGDSTSATLTISNNGAGPLRYAFEGFTGHAPAGGPDAFGYTWTDSDRPGGPVFNWVDISETGTALALGDDTWEDVLLPFPFPFYGDVKGAVRIASNGYLTFGNQRGDVWDAKPIPHNWPPNDFIAPYWTDLDPSVAGSAVYYGTDEEGRFIVQYDSVTTHSAPTWRTTFQVILEPGGNIVFQYLERTAPFSGTIGIENADATDGLEVSHNEFPPYVHDSLAVRIDAPTPWIPSVTPASGIIAAGGSAEVTIAVDADTLEQGEYLASLRIASNDPDRPWARVPVLLEVSGTLRLSLVAGWNLVSWNVEPENMAVEAVLAGILDRVQAVETYEGGERRWYVPGQTGNTLATLMPTYGYWIKLSDNALLEIEGTPVDRQLPLSLTGGLNAVSYLPWHSNGVGNALETIMAVTTTAASFEGTGITYATDVPAAFHVLDRMEPEAGYVIRTTAPGTLVYPAPSGGQSTGGEGQPTLEGRLLAEAEAGVTPTMAWLDVWGANVRLDGGPLPLGTRVVALDGQNRPVGAFDVVAEGNLGLMALYADDPYTAEKDGALPGETITLRVGAAVLAQLPWSMAGDVVDLSGTVVSTEDGGVLPTEYALERNYPNPFNPSTTIRYALPEAAHVRLTVYDGLGRLVATLVDADLPAGRHQAVWDASSVASGVYLYRLQAGAFERSYQMLLLK